MWRQHSQEQVILYEKTTHPTPQDSAKDEEQKRLFDVFFFLRPWLFNNSPRFFKFLPARVGFVFLQGPPVKTGPGWISCVVTWLTWEMWNSWWLWYWTVPCWQGPRDGEGASLKLAFEKWWVWFRRHLLKYPRRHLGDFFPCFGW